MNEGETLVAIPWNLHNNFRFYVHFLLSLDGGLQLNKQTHWEKNKQAVKQAVKQAK